MDPGLAWTFLVLGTLFAVAMAVLAISEETGLRRVTLGLMMAAVGGMHLPRVVGTGWARAFQVLFVLCVVAFFAFLFLS